MARESNHMRWYWNGAVCGGLLYVTLGMGGFKNVPISDFATSRILQKRCCPGLHPYHRGLAQKILNFTIFPFSKHKLFHSGPRIQPYAMILKWRGMRWSPPSFLGGAVAWKAPHPRLRRFIFAEVKISNFYDRIFIEKVVKIGWESVRMGWTKVEMKRGST